MTWKYDRYNTYKNESDSSDNTHKEDVSDGRIRN